MIKTRSWTPLAVILLTVTASGASAACVNRFTARTERPRQVITLLTGKLTYEEAQRLSALINSRKSPPLEWVTADGKTIAKQYGDLKIVRPMPVACDGKPSGVVMVASFPTSVKAEKKMFVKLDANTLVAFDQAD
jgi:hypothetical protein